MTTGSNKYLDLMTTAQLQKIHIIDYFNILLMLFSCAVAYLVPWQLLLAAYAILGPAHYLTQISWMHDKHYFTQQSSDYIYLILLSAIMLLTYRYYSQFMVITLCLAIAMAFSQALKWRLLLALLGVLLAIQLHNFTWLIVLLLFIPTIIHVFFFTAGFVLNGALKNNSWPGYASLLVLMGCAASFFMLTPSSADVTLSNYVSENMHYFQGMAQDLMRTLRLSDNQQHGLQVIRFIAFAYTYHYCNWFSKTGIIKWHQMSVTRIAIITMLYLTAIGLYAYSYSLGFLVLLSLSFLHVILELPLDMIMLKNTSILLYSRL